MTKSIRVHIERYRVTSYLVNLRGRAGLYSVLNFIQDVGWMHAQELQIVLPQNQGWVFTRQKLEMTDWPAWNQEIQIRTWLRRPSGPFIFRDYEIARGPEVIGRCTSTFAAMDLSTRKLASQDWDAYAHAWRGEDTFTEVPQKLEWREGGDFLGRIQVRNSDIDLNEHVNNAKYAQWILDSIPMEILKGGLDLCAYEVNFLAESRLGDEIEVRHHELSPSESIQTVTQFQGTFPGTQKPVFTARLTAKRS